ncbi:MAG: terminase TerL endonuclease subunit, partial [Gaiella sp.]
RFVCNLPTRSTIAAIQEREWHQAATAERIPDGELVWAGMDVGWQWDTTAIVPLWWRDPHFRLLGPATILEPPRDGSQLDPNRIKHALTELAARYRLTTVVMDSARAEDIASWIQDELDVQVVYRAQSSKPQAEDFERFMGALRQGWLFHSADDGLRQHALNAVTKLLPDGGSKFGRTSETRQGGNQDARVIDALVAAAMVHSHAVAEHEAPLPPVYRVGGFN